jgi:penicillin-binding protein 1C
MTRRRALKLLALLLAVAAVGGALFVLWPLPGGLLTRRGLASLRIVDRNGGLLQELRAREDGRSIPLPPEPSPTRVEQAFLAAEDHRFHRHPGVDPLAVGRALLQNVRSGHVESGASTLTMQLARRLRPRPRGLAGKIAEAFWALRLTAHLPRERILREYLDRVPLGSSAIGVEAASFLYFGRPASMLSAGQAALLAGMARSPARCDPFRHPEAAKARMLQVLEAMRRLGYLSADEERVAAAAPLDLVSPERAFRSPHFVAAVEHTLPALGLSDAALVETTIDPALQEAAESAVREELGGLADQRVGQAAALVVDNESGEILAYVGSADFFDEAHGGQNDGARALRQPGSALKPFAYGLALASGLTPATILPDIETHFATPSGGYVPHNYDRRVRGPVRLRAALANSYNVPAVRLAERLGPDRILAILRRAGFSSLDQDASHYGVGLVLGNGEVSLRELAAAYRGLARGGIAAPLHEARSATDGAGNPLSLPLGPAPVRFLPADATNLLTDILGDESARAPAFGRDNALRLPFPVAAKTGTSRAHIDNWAVGFTRERTVAVWVGNFDGTPMRGVSGITGAAPLFRRLMLLAMNGIDPAPLVDRSVLEEAEICALSGARAGPACPSRLRERFLPGTAPTEPCAMHRGSRPASAPVDYGPQFYAWAQAEGLDAEPYPTDHAPNQEGSRARLLLPVDGDEYLLEPGIDPDSQTIPVRAAPPVGVTQLELRLDGGERQPFPAPFATRIPAQHGSHTLELWVPGAEAPHAVARFVVR